jgi:hypothetical protein
MKKNNRLERVSAADLIEQREEGETAGALPPALAEALSAAEKTLAKHDRLAAALAESGRSIPQALALENQLYSQLGAAEVAGDDVDGLRSQLAAANDRRQADVRRRASAAEALLEMENELRGARAAMEQARAQYVSVVASEFRERWNRCCAELIRLHGEARELSRVLSSTITPAAPYCAAVNVVTQRPEVQLLASVEPVPVELTPGMQTLSRTIERLDLAMSIGAGVRQSRELSERYYSQMRSRGLPAQLTGTFEVTKAFNHLGTDYLAGALVSRDLLGDGSLSRLWTPKLIRPLNQPGSTAAA